MGLCASDCYQQTPRWTAACSINTREGGIPYLIFFACHFKFDATITLQDGSELVIGPITDYTQWQIGVANRLISRTPEGLGEKPLPSFTTERLSSCKPEAIANKTHNISFQSKDIDSTNLSDRDYWNDIENNYDFYRLAYMGCDDLVYYSGDDSDPGFSFSTTGLGYVIPQTNDESVYYQADVAFNYRGIPTPKNIPNLNEAFNVDVNT